MKKIRAFFRVFGEMVRELVEEQRNISRWYRFTESMYKEGRKLTKEARKEHKRKQRKTFDKLPD